MPEVAPCSTEEARSLPGWSLARDSTPKRKKQGWECPAPTVEDWQDYKAWKEEQEKKLELPAAPQVFLADSQLLFVKDPDVQLPWIHRLKCELPRRVGRLSGELPVKASYIGFGTHDDPSLYDLFKSAVAQIGIVLFRHIHHPPNRFELAHLEQSDLVVVGGGDRKRLWETLGTDIGSNQVAEHVKWRYLQGALVIAIGEAMSLLGEKSWYKSGTSIIPFTGWKIFPHVVALDDDTEDLEDLVEQLGGAGVVILGVVPGGGMIFNSDGLVEPVRHFVQEYRWDWQSSSVKRALLLGPPRSTGLICPLYAAMRDRDASNMDAENPDVWAYALTSEEEQEEELLVERFNDQNLWLSHDARQEIEELKQKGNKALKGGSADLAELNYQRARVLLKDTACTWSDLSLEERTALEAVDSQKRKLLPSERRHDSRLHAGTQKNDYQAAALLTSLLLNLCACHLLAHDQDMERQRKQSSLPQTCEPVETRLRHVDSTGVSQLSGHEELDVPNEVTTLVELRDHLVEAFVAANDALLLTAGRSAKAWYRRGCVFRKMRDPRNALRDFEEALAREPGEKEIVKKRDEVKEAANLVAENMYYARHKALDEQEDRFNLKDRDALVLRGCMSDPYSDKQCEFAVGQPIARLVDGKLEDADGRLQFVVSGGDSASSDEMPYLHPRAFWTWEFLVQRACTMRLLCIEQVDLGAGPLEWLCKGLRIHQTIQVLHLIGTHVGPAGAKMLRNVIAQNQSLVEIAFDMCALHDAGLDEIAEGLCSHSGSLESLSLQKNYFTSRRLGKLVTTLCSADYDLSLTHLDLSGNKIGSPGANEVGRIIGSGAHKLREIRIVDCLVDVAGFWRLVGNLDDARPMSRLDLRRNPIGRGTWRCWRGTMGPNIRCEVLLSENPFRARMEAQQEPRGAGSHAYPMPDSWI